MYVPPSDSPALAIFDEHTGTYHVGPEGKPRQVENGNGKPFSVAALTDYIAKTVRAQELPERPVDAPEQEALEERVELLTGTCAR